MRLPNEWASKITDKNPDVAKKAAKHIINNKDLDAWYCLAEHEESIFDFVKDKVTQYISEAVDDNNFMNLFSLMHRYNDWLADIVAVSLSKFDDYEISRQVLHWLDNGNDDYKAYSARYFAYTNFMEAEDVLIKSLNSTNDALRINAAQALGATKSSKALEILIKKLDSEDDFEKVNAAELLSSYNSLEAVKPILLAMKNCNMKENLASEAATMVCLADLFNDKDEEMQLLSLEALNNIVNGLSEVLPLGNILVYDLYQCIDSLIKLAEKNNSSFSGLYSQILIRAKYKFNILANNDQYTYDEDKETKEEIEHINNILQLREQTFWDDVNYLLLDELSTSDLSRKSNAIMTVAETKLKFAGEKLVYIICNDVTPETILCEAVYAVQELQYHEALPYLKKILQKITDPNRAGLIINAIQYLEGCEKGILSQIND